MQRDDSKEGAADALSSSNGAPTFEISYSLTGSLTKLKVDALKVEQELLAFFTKTSVVAMFSMHISAELPSDLKAQRSFV